jgi:periplasmic mercuric ion binding protein
MKRVPLCEDDFHTTSKFKKNKRMKKITLILTLLLMISVVGFAQKAKPDTIRIQTSGQCGMCKERIEKALVYEKGVKSAEYNEDNAVVTVIYNPAKTTPDKLRKVITALGHDADDQPGDPKAYSKLPNCCKKPQDR